MTGTISTTGTDRMKLGILGIDPRIALAVASATARGDTIVIACDLRPDDPTAAAIGPDVPRDPSWEPLLDARSCDAILVGTEGWCARRAEGVRALVQAGRTLLVSHPLELSMLWAYELDMIRADSGARLIPFLPERLHPFIGRLRSRIELGLAGAGPAGAVETVTMERRLSDRSRSAVLTALARDIDLVRALTGDPARLSTLGTGDADAAWGSLAVGFSGPAHLPVRWQACRGREPGLRITVTDAEGACTVDVPDQPSPDQPGSDQLGSDQLGLPWTWTDGTHVETAAFDPGGAMLDQIRPRPDRLSPPAAAPERVVGADVERIPAATWPDAARAVELAETVPRSLAKGRAIDLHQEEFSEIGTFRGTMASLGCGLVLGALVLLVIATLVGGIARAAGWGFAERIAGAWPRIVLAALGVFLTLQLLPLLVGPARRPDDTPPPAGGRE